VRRRRPLPREGTGARNLQFGLHRDLLRRRTMQARSRGARRYAGANGGADRHGEDHLSGAQDELERAGDEPSISGRPSTIIASDISDAAQREAESIADPFGDDAPEIALLTEDEEERVSTPPPPPPEALAASASGNDDEDSVIELEGTEVEEELDEAADIEEDDEELELDEAD